MANILRKIYDATSDSRSSFGKVGKWLPFTNSQYFIRDAWRKYGKKYFNPQNNSAAVVSSGDIYGPTGSIVGRF